MFSPSSEISPDVGSTSRTMARPSVVLPQPLSPTRPSVSPGAMLKLTSSTAFTNSRTRLNIPCFTGKCTFRFLTSSRLMIFEQIKLKYRRATHRTDNEPNQQDFVQIFPRHQQEQLPQSVLHLYILANHHLRQAMSRLMSHAQNQTASRHPCQETAY